MERLASPAAEAGPWGGAGWVGPAAACAAPPRDEVRAEEHAADEEGADLSQETREGRATSFIWQLHHLDKYRRGMF